MPAEQTLTERRTDKITRAARDLDTARRYLMRALRALDEAGSQPGAHASVGIAVASVDDARKQMVRGELDFKALAHLDDEWERHEHGE